MKKGYTLVELLAVIIILALLFTLAYGGVSQYIKYSNDNAFAIYEKNLKSIAEEYVNNDINYVVGSYNKCMTVSALVDEKYIKDYVTKNNIKYLKHYKNKTDYVCDGYVTMEDNGTDLLITPYLSCGKYENNDITVDKQTTNYSKTIRNGSGCEQ